MHFQIDIARKTFAALVKNHAAKSDPPPIDVTTLVLGNDAIPISITKVEMHFRIEDVELRVLDPLEAPYARADGSVGMMARDTLGIEIRVKTWLHGEGTVVPDTTVDVSLKDVLVTYRIAVSVAAGGKARLTPQYQSYKIDGSDELTAATTPVLDEHFRSYEVPPVDFEAETLLTPLELSLDDHPLRNAALEPKNVSSQVSGGKAPNHVAFRLQFAPVTKDYFRFPVSDDYGGLLENHNCSVTICSETIESILARRMRLAATSEGVTHECDDTDLARWTHHDEFQPPPPPSWTGLESNWSEHGITGHLTGEAVGGGFQANIITSYYARFGWEADALQVLVRSKTETDITGVESIPDVIATVVNWLVDTGTGWVLSTVAGTAAPVDPDTRQDILAVPLVVKTDFGSFTGATCHTYKRPPTARVADPKVTRARIEEALYSPADGYLQIAGNLSPAI